MRKHKFTLLLLALGLSLFSQGIYIFAKAELAQYLIERAWHTKLRTGEEMPPWPWADTHTIGKLTLADHSWYVLAGASARNLAFAPTHVSASVSPGQLGNSVIVGHRDTQFSQLQHLKSGDIIKMENLRGLHKFKVISTRVTHVSQIQYLYQEEQPFSLESNQANLTLITCYPFNSVSPNPTHRYVVRGVAI